MQKGSNDFKYLLLATCEITNFVLAIPIKTRVDNVIAKALIHRVICILDTHTSNSRQNVSLYRKNYLFHTKNDNCQ